MNETEKQINNAVIYCRVSTKEQVEEGNSLVSQQKLCSEYAFKNGFTLLKIFIEEGESAKNANRPELKNLLNFCTDRKNKITAVIVYKLDRISRNTHDYSQIRIMLKRHNVEIKSVTEFFEDTPAGRFMENIIANVAQFDNDVRIERCIGGMREAMHEGRYVWRAPKGYSNARVDGKMNIVPNKEAKIIQALFKRVAENTASSEEIRKAFINHGLASRNNTPISKSRFHSILKHEAYKGWIVKLGERHKGSYTPLVDEAIFEHVQLVLKGRSKKTIGYKVQNPDFPLRRFVNHPDGNKLTGAWSKGRSKKYAYYQFQGNHKSFPKGWLEQKFINFLNQFALNQNQLELFMRAAIENYKAQIMESQEQQKKLWKGVEEVKLSKRQLVEKNLKNLIDDPTFTEHLKYLDEKLYDLNKQLLSAPINDNDLIDVVEFAKHYLSNPGGIWNKLDLEAKFCLQRFNFPSGVTFDGKIFRTEKLANVLKLKSFFWAPMFCTVHNRVRKLNHSKKKKIPDIGKSPPLHLQPPHLKLNKEKAKELDLKAFFDDLQEVKAIVEGKKPKEKVVKELGRNPLDELLKEAA